MSKLTNILGDVAAVVSIIGIILYFGVGSYAVVYCAAFCMLTSIFAVIWGGQNSLYTEIMAIIIGLIVALKLHMSILIAVSLAMCFEGLIIDILLLISMIIFTVKVR